MLKIVGVANVSVDFVTFFYNLLEPLGNADNVSIVTTACASSRHALRTSVNSFAMNVEYIVWLL